jgi:high-affinity Fe2+/Pb2+ permease
MNDRGPLAAIALLPLVIVAGLAVACLLAVAIYVVVVRELVRVVWRAATGGGSR